MTENFHNELQPHNEIEQALIDMMATARWRQMRLWGIERAAITQETLDTPARAALAFRHLADNSRSLDLINRYETANSRLFFRALQRLTSLRANPTADDPGPVERELPPVGPEVVEFSAEAAATPDQDDPNPGPSDVTRTTRSNPRNRKLRNKAKYRLFQTKSTTCPVDKTAENGHYPAMACLA
jgi:hypothetical protein